jgi:2-polyprenyl-6-methoxyphenol hydroxylase-like FAD-dependent oxidoreductase
MATSRVTVAGAGMAGLCSTLLLARRGYAVTLLERDPWVAGELAPTDRRGIPHYRQPHALIPRARAELARSMPDVFEGLLAMGSDDVDLRPKLPGRSGPADEDLRYLAVRRPVLEGALRRAVDEEPTVTVRAGVRLRGLRVAAGRAVGVDLDEGEIETDLVVDGLGRRSCLRPLPSEQTSDCGVVYYSRYYRLRPGATLPDGPWLLSPRGDLGYMAYASFPGDNGTFAAVLAVPPGDPDWKAFRHEDVFEAAVAEIPTLASWADPALVEPITGLMAMSGLRNLAPPVAFPLEGYVAVGDSFSHTDPVLAHGIAFCLVHAATLVALLDEHGVDGVGEAYLSRMRPEAQERFELATALDAQRLRMWCGDSVDVSPAGDYALFTMAAGGAVAAVDPEVFRVFVRRIGLLDSTRVLDDDVALQRRIAERFAELMASPRPAQGPSRDEMLELVREPRPAVRDPTPTPQSVP